MTKIACSINSQREWQKLEVVYQTSKCSTDPPIPGKSREGIKKSWDGAGFYFRSWQRKQGFTSCKYITQIYLKCVQIHLVIWQITLSNLSKYILQFGWSRLLGVDRGESLLLVAQKPSHLFGHNPIFSPVPTPGENSLFARHTTIHIYIYIYMYLR